MNDDITILDTADPDDLADDLEAFSGQYAKRTGDYTNASMMLCAAEWLRHLSEEAQK